MDLNTELITLRNMVDATRQLVHFALKKMEGRSEEDMKKRFEFEGRKMNSIYWIVAHMAWAENNLIIRSLGGPNPELPWLKHFALGKPAEEGESCGVPYSEIYAGFKKVHQIAMETLNNLNPEELNSDNLLNWEILGGKTKRNTIMHHVRHENNHTGQLSWLVNLHGEKTI